VGNGFGITIDCGQTMRLKLSNSNRAIKLDNINAIKWVIRTEQDNSFFK